MFIIPENKEKGLPEKCTQTVGFIDYHQTKPLILKQSHILFCNRKIMQDLDFCHSVVETFALLECYTA